MRDKDGFLILERNEKLSEHVMVKVPMSNTKKKSNRQTIDTKPKNPFKKGSWKHHFWKVAMRYLPHNFIRKFHNTRMMNVSIHHPDGEAIQCGIHYGPWDGKFLKNAIKEDKDGTILVNCGGNMFMRIPLKSYKKLSKISKIVIDFKLSAWYDGECEVCDIYNSTQVIDNINDLLSFINYHQQSIFGIYEIQAQCCGYTDFNYDFRILVVKNNGKTETYHSDMNDFMKEYGLRLF